MRPVQFAIHSTARLMVGFSVSLGKRGVATSAFVAWRRNSALRRGMVMAGSLLVFAGSVWAQEAVESGRVALSANEIALRMMGWNAARQEALEHYTGERTYRVDYRGTGGAHSAVVGVHVDYAAGQKRLTVVWETGSKMICERVLRRLVESEQEASEGANRMQTTLSPQNYDLELVGEESVGGVRAWLLRVAPKVESKFTYRGQVWVSEEDYALVRVLGEPAKSPSWWINRSSFDWRYAKNGEFWLPEKNVAKSHVKMGGDATLTIEYGAYQILSAKAVRHEEDRNPSGGVRTATLISGRVPGP